MEPLLGVSSCLASSSLGSRPLIIVAPGIPAGGGCLPIPAELLSGRTALQS